MAASLETAAIAIDAELEKQLEELEGCSPEQYHEQALTLAKICILLPRTSQQQASSLSNKLHLMVRYLQSPDVDVQVCLVSSSICLTSAAVASGIEVVPILQPYICSRSSSTLLGASLLLQITE
jgi:hypothetical protein